jgi:hypothetical protein
MDFTWVAPTTGDITGVTAGTGITGGGTSGDVTVSLDQANFGGGQRAAGKNKIINGDFSIWQRGTNGTIAAGSYVAADRYYTYRNTTGSTFSRQTSGLTGFQYSGRIARDSGNTATANISVGQSIETANSLALANQTVTLSFWAKAGANFSATSSILRARLLSSTTENQNIVLNGGTSVIDQNVTLTTSWQRFSYSGSVGSTALTVGTIFSYDPTGTAGAADNFEITGMQVEIGSIATPFQTASGSIQGELSLCQRYYSTSIPTGYTVTDFPIMGTSGAGGQIFWATGTSDLFGSLQYPVPMRGTPTFTAYSGNNRTAGNARDMTTGSDITFTPAPQTGNNRLLSYVTVASTATSGRPYGFQWTASAEL